MLMRTMMHTSVDGQRLILVLIRMMMMIRVGDDEY